jgi:hypothetical protein
MLISAALMFLSQSTYPGICSDVVKLSTKYNKATNLVMHKARRVAEYIYGCSNTHCLILALKLLCLKSSADASYAEYVDGFDSEKS